MQLMLTADLSTSLELVVALPLSVLSLCHPLVLCCRLPSPSPWPRPSPAAVELCANAALPPPPQPPPSCRRHCTVTLPPLPLPPPCRRQAAANVMLSRCRHCRWDRHRASVGWLVVALFSAVRFRLCMLSCDRQCSHCRPLLPIIVFHHRHCRHRCLHRCRRAATTAAALAGNVADMPPHVADNTPCHSNFGRMGPCCRHYFFDVMAVCVGLSRHLLDFSEFVCRNILWYGGTYAQILSHPHHALNAH